MNTKTTSELIRDDQRLVGASTMGIKIPVYDDGFGPLWIHRDSIGISGIVRAQTWEEAYEICEDEFFPEADETVEEFQREYSVVYKSGMALWMERGGSLELWNNLVPEQKFEINSIKGEKVKFEGDFTEHPYFQEAYGFRPNGPNSKDKIKHGIYAKDLNGDWLEELTPAILRELQIELAIENE